MDNQLYSILAAKVHRTRREIIMTFWSKLDDIERDVMRLRYYNELSYDKIMSSLSLSRNAVIMSEQSALSKFRQYPIKGENR